MERNSPAIRAIADLCELLFCLFLPMAVFWLAQAYQMEQAKEIVEIVARQHSQISTANPESVGGSKGPVVWPVRADTCPHTREQGDPEELGSSKGFN